MTRPRYSIIPGGASTNPNLEGHDLRVLCYLGEHTNKLGWCFLSQGTIAAEIHIGRATVQRSLARLVAAGYVEIKSSVVSGRPHACHAYRVIMDRDDPEIGPSELEVEDQEREGGCPPAGTQVPTHGGQGCPSMDGHGVPTHTRAHNDQDSVLDVVGSARAREAVPMISEDAHAIADELAVIAGHDPQFLPTNWVSYGPAMRVQMGLNRGWSRQMMIDVARSMMLSKIDGPPNNIRYFEKAFDAAHQRQSLPPPLPSAATPTEKPYGQQPTAAPPDWRARRDQQHSAFAEFRAATHAAAERERDERGGPVVQLVPNARRS